MDFKKTHPVGLLTPNSYGLYDVQGNVWEWVSDWYAQYSSSSVKDPTGPGSGSERVLRGGGWGGIPCDHCYNRILRLADRASYEPASNGVDVGFRLVRTINP